MIRFCDKEVSCLLYEDLNRGELMSFFLKGHMNDIVCVIHEDGSYAGAITYHRLLYAANAQEAVSEECVVFDEYIWENARRYFACYELTGVDEHALLPVINENRELICFAYEDSDANREIRMLRELSELPEALHFSDIYPDVECVRIYDFNELAYFFARYLESQNIAVQVIGDMWQYFFEGKDCQVLDYSYMTVYAEGTERKCQNWIENLVRSVSVEFECVDKIYKANLKRGIIKNAEGEWGKEIANYLRSKRVVILGIGTESQDAYDFLMEHGIEAECFVADRSEQRDHRLFGKPVYSRIEVMRSAEDIVFIQVTQKHSAWDVKAADYYDYIGYRRNDSFFVLKDYVNLPCSSLKHTLKNARVVLMGDCLLCEKLGEYLNKVLMCKESPVFANVFAERDEQLPDMPVVDLNDIHKEMICLIAFPEFAGKKWVKLIDSKKKELIYRLKQKEIDNFTDYFSYTFSFINVVKEIDAKCVRQCLRPDRIVLGSIEAYSGNIFLRGLLDNHPSIMMISDYRLSFNNDLFWICVRLANKESEDILPLLQSMFQNECREDLSDMSAFNGKVGGMLKEGERYTSQELFVMFHIGYMYMRYGRDIPDMSNMVLYWEPHNIGRNIVEEFSEWLGAAGISCSILNVVRNICVRNGSGIKESIRNGHELVTHKMICYPNIEKKSYGRCKRYVVRFEDIKCNPREILQKLCDELGIPWSETLMETTRHGQKYGYDNGKKQVYDFDLTPVYNTYEEYFSGFDRFRIMLISAPWQKKYGYPYVDISDFSDRELQEMFLKEFRFEKERKFSGEKERLEEKIRTMKWVRGNIWKNRMLDFEDNSGCSFEKEE